MNTLYNVLIIGATGLVGTRLVEILIENKFPFNNLKLVASPSSIGKTINILDGKFVIDSLNDQSFNNIDFCFFCSNSEVSKKWCELAKSKCKYVIDNSSFNRMDNNVPLIVPEINSEAINSNLISNPNCSTIQSVLVLNEIRKIYKIKRIIYSTYQSCSGGGRGVLNELNNSYYHKDKKLFDNYLCDTCISQIGNIEDNHYSKEELKMINETKKILKDDSLMIHANCIRVPISYCHGVFIYVEVEENVDVDQVIEQINRSSRLSYCSDNEIMYFQNCYNSPLVKVGRIKKDLFNDNAFSLFCVGDNLHTGAAYNAYSIALHLIKEEK